MKPPTIHLHELHTAWRRCPGCGVLHDGATGNATEMRSGHSILVCSGCGFVGMFDEAVEGNWRFMTNTEMNEALKDNEIRLLIAAGRTIADQLRLKKDR